MLPFFNLKLGFLSFKILFHLLYLIVIKCLFWKDVCVWVCVCVCVCVCGVAKIMIFDTKKYRMNLEWQMTDTWQGEFS